MESNNQISNKKNIYGQHENKIVLSLSIVLSVLILFSIGFIEYNDFNEFIPNENSTDPDFDPNSNFCKLIIKFDVVTIPIAILIIIIFIILHKRRSFCFNSFNWKNVGLPMIISSWKKSDRLFSSFIYGMIAFRVFIIFQNLIVHQILFRLLQTKTSNLKGALKEVLQILLDVFINGIRAFKIF
jgi:hypothetical protein